MMKMRGVSASHRKRRRSLPNLLLAAVSVFSSLPVSTSFAEAFSPQINSEMPDPRAPEPPQDPQAGDTVRSDTVGSDTNAAIDGQPSMPVVAPDFRGLQAPAFGATGALAASLGTTRGSYSAAPAMTGDFFGGSFVVSDFDESPNDPSIGGRTVSIAGGDRRFKIAENVSPIPRDRIFINYNHFENALNDHLGKSVSIDRYAPGFEKTFFDEMTSIEMRLPIANAMNSTQDFNSSDTRGTEVGNLAIAAKAILLAGSNWLISGGSTITLPTGDDYVERSGSTVSVVVENDAVHIAPFIGWLVTVKRDWFFQGFIQTDFDLNGNDVINGDGSLEGTIQDQNLLFVDASLGRWLVQSASRQSRLTGIAAMTELHYTMTMNDTDTVGRLTNPFQNVDVLNLTSALHFQFGLTSFRVGAAVPLRNDEERLYDAEIILQLTQAF